VFREQLRASESHQRAIEAFKTFSGENRKIKCIKAFEILMMSASTWQSFQSGIGYELKLKSFVESRGALRGRNSLLNVLCSFP
jgi:hypothetical protein